MLSPIPSGLDLGPTNPWCVLVNGTLAVFTPPKNVVPVGFRHRVETLLGISSAALLLASIQLMLVMIDLCRKNWSSAWMFRRVSRPGGRYIVTNVRLASSIMTIVNLVIMVVYLVDLWFYTTGRGDVWAGVWRAIGPVFLGTQVFLITFGQIQAYLISPAMTFGTAYQPYESKDPVKPIITACVANMIFLGWGVIASTPFLISSILAAVTYARLWSMCRALLPKLRYLEMTFVSDSINEELAIQVLLEVSQFEAYRQYCQTLYRVAYALGLVLIGGFACLNCGCFFLTRIVRARARKALNQATVINVSIERSHVNSFASYATTPKIGPADMVEALDVTKLSRSALSRIAGKASLGIDGQKAKTMLELLEAERDLLFTAYLFGTIATLVLVFGIWLEIALLGSTFIFRKDSSWAEFEALSTVLVWCAALLLLVIQPPLIRSACIALQPPAVQARRSSITFRELLGFCRESRNIAGGNGALVRVVVEQSVTEDYRTEGLGGEDLGKQFMTTIEGGKEFEYAFGVAPEIAVDVGGGLADSVGWTKPEWATEDEERRAKGLSVSRGSLDAGKGLFPPTAQRPRPARGASASSLLNSRMPTLSALDEQCIPWELTTGPPSISNTPTPSRMNSSNNLPTRSTSKSRTCRK